ncbi:MAG TPA: DNA polymerase III subunit delta [Methylibium sp.]|uniref:DNA polymerase III subunit delta n=1 Tax=Methylibium sp. TaxID=2067992 RepID=UPI002DBE39B3|nr:DNA polymerase III subunit delta [Methylibium sp.]HEU4460407.1 DNA polymerase III subunit delta [Methylibium sp.]
MQLRLDALEAQLARGLKPLYLLHGDEPLLAQEAADAIRAAARRAGYEEREVHSVAGARFDWSSLLGSAASMSLFAASKIVEIRIPSGKPGKDGSQALQRYAETLRGDEPAGVLTIVSTGRLDRQQQQSAWFAALDAAGVSLRLDPVERAALPAWIAQRLARQGQRVRAGEEGQRTLAFFADRVEGHLLAARQEIDKLGLLHPPGELSYEQVAAAVLNVARYGVPQLAEAVWAGQAARSLRMLDGLAAEGESAVFVHWTLAEDLRALRACKAAAAGGRPLAMALREQRVWGTKEKLFERLLPRLDALALDALLADAHVVDGICKGLPDARWPADAWQALRAWLLGLGDAVRAALAGSGAGRAAPLRLAVPAA